MEFIGSASYRVIRNPVLSRFLSFRMVAQVNAKFDPLYQPCHKAGDSTLEYSCDYGGRTNRLVLCNFAKQIECSGLMCSLM
jgi:hypothetical protein